MAIFDISIGSCVLITSGVIDIYNIMYSMDSFASAHRPVTQRSVFKNVFTANDRGLLTTKS